MNRLVAWLVAQAMEQIQGHWIVISTTEQIGRRTVHKLNIKKV